MFSTTATQSFISFHSIHAIFNLNLTNYFLLLLHSFWPFNSHLRPVISIFVHRYFLPTCFLTILFNHPSKMYPCLDLHFLCKAAASSQNSLALSVCQTGLMTSFKYFTASEIFQQDQLPDSQGHEARRCDLFILMNFWSSSHWTMSTKCSDLKLSAKRKSVRDISFHFRSSGTILYRKESQPWALTGQGTDRPRYLYNLQCACKCDRFDQRLLMDRGVCFQDMLTCLSIWLQ